MARISPTTIRLPIELDQQMVNLAEHLGFTKTDMIKTGILDYLVTPDKLNDFQEIKIGSGSFKRTGIRFSDTLKNILQRQAKTQNVSINSLIVYATEKTYEHYSKLLKEQGLK